MLRVEVKSELLRWATERSGVEEHDLARRFPKLADWRSGAAQPTLKQLEQFAQATFTPIGVLLLPSPPAEGLPIPDFRTFSRREVVRPSVNLLDTIYACQLRQDWYRDHARSNHLPTCRWVGAAREADDPVLVAAAMRSDLRFEVDDRARCSAWSEAFRLFRAKVDDIGVLVMCSGVVGNNSHRPLDPDEFCGFALSDPIAPLIFVNGATTKAAQMFTLAHELAHLRLGASALSNATLASRHDEGTERWCNAVAAEFLAPLAEVRRLHRRGAPIVAELQRLARHFKTSTLVVLRRLLDARALTRDRFDDLYQAESARLAVVPRGKGGDFFLTESARVGLRFGKALITSTIEGSTTYRDAMQLLGIVRFETFEKFSHHVERSER